MTDRRTYHPGRDGLVEMNLQPQPLTPRGGVGIVLA